MARGVEYIAYRVSAPFCLRWCIYVMYIQFIRVYYVCMVGAYYVSGKRMLGTYGLCMRYVNMLFILRIRFLMYVFPFESVGLASGDRHRRLEKSLTQVH